MYNYSNSWYCDMMDDVIQLFNKFIKKKYTFTAKEQNLINEIIVIMSRYNLTHTNLSCLEFAIQSLNNKIDKDPDFDLFKTKIQLLKNALYGFV